MRSRAGQQGFSLIETTVAMVIAVTVISTVTIGMKASHDSARSMEQRQQEARVAGEILDLVFRIPVGEPSDPPASGAQRTELFDGDEDLGTTTLYGLRHGPLEAGHVFQIADFPYAGNWEVRVSGDLDGDGDEDEPEEVFDDLLRVDVLFSGRIVLQSARGVVMG